MQADIVFVQSPLEVVIGGVEEVVAVPYFDKAIIAAKQLARDGLSRFLHLIDFRQQKVKSVNAYLTYLF